MFLLVFGAVLCASGLYLLLRRLPAVKAGSSVLVRNGVDVKLAAEAVAAAGVVMSIVGAICAFEALSDPRVLLPVLAIGAAVLFVWSRVKRGQSRL